MQMGFLSVHLLSLGVSIMEGALQRWERASYTRARTPSLCDEYTCGWHRSRVVTAAAAGNQRTLAAQGLIHSILHNNPLN